MKSGMLWVVLTGVVLSPLAAPAQTTPSPWPYRPFTGGTSSAPAAEAPAPQVPLMAQRIAPQDQGFTAPPSEPARPVYWMSATDWKAFTPRTTQPFPDQPAPSAAIEVEPIPAGGAAADPAAAASPTPAASPTSAPTVATPATPATSATSAAIWSQPTASPSSAPGAIQTQPVTPVVTATPSGDGPTASGVVHSSPVMSSPPGAITPTSGVQPFAVPPAPVVTSATSSEASPSTEAARPANVFTERSEWNRPTPAQPASHGVSANTAVYPRREYPSTSYEMQPPATAAPPTTGPAPEGTEVIEGIPIELMPQHGPSFECPDPANWYIGYVDPRCRATEILPPDKRRWYTRGEYLYWDRSNMPRQNISFSDATNQIALDTGKVDFDFDSGMRITIGKLLDKNPRQAIEVSYASLFRQSRTAAVNDPGGDLVTFFGVGGGDGFNVDAFDFATQHRITYESEFHNIEANFVHRFRPIMNLQFETAGGLRYFILSEKFDLLSRDDTAPVERGVYNIDSISHIVGPQAGGTIYYPIGDGGWVYFRTKGGLAVNIAAQKSDIYNAGDLVQRSQGDEWNITSMLELALGARIELSPRAELRAGYELLIFSSAALAPNQLDWGTSFTSQALVDTDASLYYHGISAGGTYRW